MDGLTLLDWFSVPALVGAGGWALSSAMAIHGLYLANQSRRRSIVYILLCAPVFLLAMFLGAQQHRDARIAESKGQEIIDDMTEIKEVIRADPSLSNSETLKRVLSSLRSQLGARSVLPERQGQLVQALKRLGRKSVKIEAIQGSEPRELALELFALFKEADWDVNPQIDTEVLAETPVGLQFSWKAGDRAPQWINDLAAALSQSGIAVSNHGETSGSIADSDSVVILVGEKPGAPLP